ncbi:MAG TPA: glutathione S-transferase family protein [Polyangia bacterium]|nr:glutathione S-transferase family protein [Polyangia bacterium]
MPEYTLYGFAQSGHCYKVALCLELAGADWKPRFVDYFNGETHTPAYRAINVMGEAPVLDHGDLRLTQSGVMLDYLAERYPQLAVEKIAGGDPAQQREVLRWLLWDNHKLTSYTATFRYFRVLAAKSEPAVLAEFGKRARAAWTVLDTHLGGRSFVVGNRLSIVDLSICGYLFFEDELGVDWNDFPNLRDWLGRIRAQPRWKHPYDLLPGHPLQGKK